MIALRRFRRRRFSVAPAMLLLSVVTIAVSAQPRPYVTVRLPQGLSLQLPRNWWVLSENQKVTLEAAVTANGIARGQADFSSDLNFAANYYDDLHRTAGIVNVRFYPDHDVSQRDVQSLTPADIRMIDGQLKEQNTAAMARLKRKILSWDGTTEQTINGMTALVTGYRRTSPNGVFRVRLVRILDDARSFTLTISYREDDAGHLEPITSYVISTLRRSR